MSGGRHAGAQVAALRFLREIGGIVGTAEAIGEQRAKQDDNGGDHADFHPARPLLNAFDAQKGIERLAGAGKARVINCTLPAVRSAFGTSDARRVGTGVVRGGSSWWGHY